VYREGLTPCLNQTLPKGGRELAVAEGGLDDIRKEHTARSWIVPLRSFRSSSIIRGRLVRGIRLFFAGMEDSSWSKARQ